MFNEVTPPINCDLIQCSCQPALDIKSNRRPLTAVTEISVSDSPGHSRTVGTTEHCYSKIVAGKKCSDEIDQQKIALEGVS